MLRRDVVASFRQRIGRSANEVLAAIALGGDGGMPIDAVAACLGTLARDVRLAAAELRAGGVLTEVADATLSVVPAALRTALVREAFFSQGASRTLVSLGALLAVGPRFEEAALEIVRCARSGGRVAAPDLRDVVLRAQESAPHRSRRVWREAALVDPSAARWVLEQYPGNVTGVARETLHHAPERTVAALLRAAEEASGEIRNTLDHPLRVLSDWCRELAGGEGESMDRRRMLLSCVDRYVAEGGDVRVAVQAGFLALDPSLDGHYRDPGLGKTFTLRWRILSGPSIAKLGELWSEVRALVLRNPEESWPHVSDLLWKCAHPDGIHPTPLTQESHAALRSLGQQIARDLTPMADGRPGIGSRLEEYAPALGAALDLPRDETFEALFPPGADDEPTEVDRTRIEHLAEEWSHRSSADVVQTLTFYENEQRFVAHGRGNLLRELCEAIADRVDNPEEWIGDPIQGGAPPLLLAPLVARCVRQRRSAVADVVALCLGAPSLAWKWVGVDGALRARGLPAPILQRALDAAGRFPDHVQTLCSRGAVPIETLERLLESDVVVQRTAAVVGEWLAEPRKEVRDQIRERWHAAIARTRMHDLDELRQSSSLEFWLGEIFRSDPEMSLDWLRCVLPGAHPRLRIEGPLGAAIGGLSSEQRIALLATLARARVALDPHELPTHLVAGDAEVYRALLSTPDLRGARSTHLAPLVEPTRSEWPALARQALRAGYAPDDVAAASLDVGDRLGDDTARLRRCREAFNQLRSGDDAGLAAVGRAGVRLVDAGLARASALARRQALRGI